MKTIDLKCHVQKYMYQNKLSNNVFWLVYSKYLNLKNSSVSSGIIISQRTYFFLTTNSIISRTIHKNVIYIVIPNIFFNSNLFKCAVRCMCFRCLALGVCGTLLFHYAPLNWAMKNDVCQRLSEFGQKMENKKWMKNDKNPSYHILVAWSSTMFIRHRMHKRAPNRIVLNVYLKIDHVFIVVRERT